MKRLFFILFVSSFLSLVLFSGCGEETVNDLEIAAAGTGVRLTEDFFDNIYSETEDGISNESGETTIFNSFEEAITDSSTEPLDSFDVTDESSNYSDMAGIVSGIISDGYDYSDSMGISSDSYVESVIPDSYSQQSGYVWIPQSGKKYHSKSSCSNMSDPTKVTVSEAESRGYTKCKRCY